VISSYLVLTLNKILNKKQSKYNKTTIINAALSNTSCDHETDCHILKITQDSTLHKHNNINIVIIPSIFLMNNKYTPLQMSFSSVKIKYRNAT